MNYAQIKYVLKTLLSIFLITFLGDKAIFFALNLVNEQVYSGQGVGKLNQYMKLKDSVNLLVFGNSKANFHVDNIQLDSNSFNMGIAGRNIVFAATLIKLLGNKPQILLVQIDPQYVYDEMYQGEDILSLKSLYNKNSVVKKEFEKLHFDNYFQDVFCSISYNSQLSSLLSNYFKPKYDHKTYYGFNPLVATDAQKKYFIKKLKAKRKEPCPNTFKLNAIVNNYLIDVKNIAVQKNKNVIFFTAPLYNDYCKADNEFLAKTMRSNNLIYYDFSDFFKENNSIDFWRDEIHLSNIGADAFTKGLRAKLFTK